jgi:uncharacterized protein YcnI
VTILLALAVPARAPAHVTLTPERATTGADATVAFTVPNEEQTEAIVGFSVVVPKGFAAEGIQAKSGWRVTRAGAAVRWSGGAIAPGQFETFAISGSAPRTAGTLTFLATEQLPGQTLHYTPKLVVAAVAAPAKGRDTGARGLAKLALAIAIVGAVAAVGAFFLALSLWLRGARSLQET